MSFKKILAVVMACAMAIGAFAASALTLDVAEVADGTTDEVAVLAATTLPAAVDGVVTLTEDVVLAETLVINSDVTIDLAGYKITSADASGEEAIVSTLIYVSNGATLTVKDTVGGGKVVGGTRTNSKAYNGLYYTIKVENAKLVVDGAVIEGSKGINTKYGGTAISASNSDVVIANAVIKGGDVEKNGITASNYENYYYKYQGECGEAVYASYSTVKISKSEIYGGNGVADDITEVSYISGGANQAEGGIAIYGTRETTNIEISESIVKGGDSELYNAANAVFVSYDANVAITDSTVTGGSCLVKNGYGIAGAGISTSHDSSEVTVIGSTVTGGSTDDSWIGSAIEITNQSNGAIIKIEDSTLATGSGEGNGADAYAIETENVIGTETVELKNVTLKAVEGKTGVISESVGTVTAEGTLNTEGGDLGTVVVETTTGVAVNGDTNVAKKIVARVNGKGFETLGEAVAASTTGDTVYVISDVTTDDGFAVDGKKITVDFGGNTWYLKDANENGTTRINHKNGADVTYTNGTIDVSEGNDSVCFFGIGVYDQTTATMTFDGVTVNGENYDSGYAVFYPHVAGGVLNIKNSTINLKGEQGASAGVIKAEVATAIVNIDKTTMVLDDVKRGFVNSNFAITDSDITFKNLNKTALRNFNGTITDTNIDIDNADFGIENDNSAALSISILGNSSVKIENSKTDGVLLATAATTLTVADTAELVADSVSIADGTPVTGTVVSKADEIKVEFVQVDVEDDGTDNKEGYDLYNINLVGANGEVINRLNSADLTFVLDATPVTGAAMDYEIIAVEKITVTPDTTTPNENRFMFNFNGKDAVADTENTITIAQVKISGYGTYTFSVDTTANATNVVHATTISDNIVDTFVPGGATGKGTLDLDDSSVGKNIAVPTRKLTVKVAFPNSVVDNAAAYQDMKVEITGNIDGVHQTVTYDLGGNMEADGTYVVEETRLVLNETYNVVVSGAGYRTARYTVTMTDAKVLNFWNNVKDNAVEVEEGKASSAVAKNFLAGDIVGDNQINIYDLSAVVSYFATEITDEADYDKYVKYDLNRDGVIDSKDVAYVLVSWGK